MRFRRTIAAVSAATILFSGAAVLSPSAVNQTVLAAESETQPITGTEAFVTRMYNVVLGRNPDSAGLRNWVEKLNSHESEASDIILGFFFSSEYINKKKTADEQVTDCYNAMLGRNPDPTGMQNWKKRLESGMTLRTVCAGFAGSTEFMNLCDSYGISSGKVTLTYARDKNFERTDFVYRLYKNCLGRNPDTAGLENWCRNIENGQTGAKIAEGFIFSKEYKEKYVTNEEFVTMLYNTILGRNPDANGLASWTEKLNYRNTRPNVTNGFLFSNEFKEQCSKAGINVGSKLAEKDSSVDWQYNIQIVNEINYLRAQHGYSPVVTRYDLWEDVAMVRARELHTQFYGDLRPDGTDWTSAYNDVIYSFIKQGYYNPLASETKLRYSYVYEALDDLGNDYEAYYMGPDIDIVYAGHYSTYDSYYGSVYDGLVHYFAVESLDIDY